MYAAPLRTHVFYLALLLGILCISPTQAAATNVQCGEVIMQDTTLDNDLLNCPGDGLASVVCKP